MILLTGAAGTLGGEIAKHLKKKNKPFKCLVRETSNVEALEAMGATLVTGDVRDKAALNEAMTGVTAVISTHTMGLPKKDLSYWEVDYESNKFLIEQLQKSGGGKYVYISALSVTPDASFLLYQVKGEIENLLKESELDYTILSPSAFFSDFTRTAGTIKKYHVYPAFGGRKLRIQAIHPEDVAICAVDALDNEKASRQRVPMGGPDVITSKEATEIYSEVLGFKVRTISIPAGIPKTAAKIYDLFTGHRYNISSILDAWMRNSVSDNEKLHAIFDIELITLKDHIKKFVEQEWEAL